MLSYTNRRMRWWSALQELDSTMMLSDSLRAELFARIVRFVTSGDPCDQSTRHPKNFEGYRKVLIDHYSGVHLREGGKTWQGRSSPMPGKGKSYSNHSGKGKSTYRSAYVSYPEADERSSSTWETMEETFETNFDEGDSHAWLGDGFDEKEEAQEQGFDYIEDEEEAIALNAMVDLKEADIAKQEKLSSFSSLQGQR